MVMVRLSDLTKIFRGLRRQEVAVDHVDLEIQDGEFMTLLGPSGCGKTTTLRMIAGLETPTSGDIFFDDQRVTNANPQKRNVAMVFQNIALYPHMTVWQNMAYGLKLHKVPMSEMKKQIEEVAELLHLKPELLEKKPGQLSGGQQQRVALGRAIVREPKLFLFDEPLSNIDAKLRDELRIEIINIHNRLKTTMVYVTHDQKEAMTMSSRIAVMERGKVLQVDTPLNIYNRPANEFVMSFVGTPTINFIDCSLVDVKEKPYIESPDFKIPVSENTRGQIQKNATGEHLAIGVRPQHLLLCMNDEPPHFEAKIPLVEISGPTMTVYAKTMADTLRVESPTDPRINQLEKVGVRVVTESAFVIDKKSGKTVAYGL